MRSLARAAVDGENAAVVPDSITYTELLFREIPMRVAISLDDPEP